MTTEDDCEQVDVRNVTSSLKDSVDDVVIATNLGEKTSLIIVNLDRKLPVPLFAYVSMCNLEIREMQALDYIDRDTEGDNGHSLGHEFG